jgi:hypothetical protein
MTCNKRDAAFTWRSSQNGTPSLIFQLFLSQFISVEKKFIRSLSLTKQAIPMDTGYNIQILNEWKTDFQDLTIYDNLDGTFELAASSTNSLYYWKSSSTSPQVVSVGSYRKDTLYISKHPDTLYLWAFNDSSGKINSVNLSNGQIYQIALPDNFVLNNITYYCSARLSKTICLIQGSASGYSQLYYSELSSEGSYKSWLSWGSYYIGKPLVVESDSVLWVFVTYGYYNDWQYLCYCWSYTKDLNWGKWHTMSYIGKDYHINSLVGVNARNTGGGYGVMTTNAEGAHFIKPNGGHDDWPVDTGIVIGDSFYRSSFTKTAGTTFGNVGNFVYLKNGQLSLISAWIKESKLDSEFIQDNVTAFSVSQLAEDDDKFKGFPLVFCKDSTTYLGIVVSDS